MDVDDISEMMKRCLLYCLAFSLTFPSTVITNAQESEKLPISVTVTKSQRAPLQNSDLIVLDLEVTNNGKKPFELYSSGLVLFDSKERVFKAVNSFELSNQDEVKLFDISCEFLLLEEIQPGITLKVRDLCFQVPQERNLEYGLIIAESDYEYCGSSNQFLRQECKALKIGEIGLTASAAEEIAQSDPGGCLIATAAYESELSDEVQNLREIRNKMYKTKIGGELMKTVNGFYYSFSPTVADWERQNIVFKETIKLLITPSMFSFTILDHNTINTEDSLIGYVVSVILLNAGIYFILPIMVLQKIKRYVP